MLGDSITAGVRPGVKQDETFSALVETELRRRGIAVEVLNVGVPGERIDQAVERLDTDVLAHKPAVVTIMYGTNDSFVDNGQTEPRLALDEYRRILTGILDTLQKAEIRPVLMTEPRWGPRAINGLGENPNPRLETYMETWRAVARERNIALVDNFADWKKAEDDGTDTSNWTVDQCHPTAAGHRRIADLMLPVIARAVEEKPPEVVALRDIDYGGAGNSHQTLDIYSPRAPHARTLPLVVFIHGGGWEGGDKDEFVRMMLPLVESGDFVGASINYRLTSEGPHPLQIHDAKGAIRWLRANAARYNIDPARVAVFGVSAGGHLASLVGTSGGIAELEGNVGGNLDQSTRVACVVNFCGPSDFIAFAGQSSRIDFHDAGSIVGRLLGGPPKDKREVARAASPVTYVSADDPPFLHIHGSKDDVVPIAQTLGFDKALEAVGVSSTVLVGEGGGHLFYSEQIKTRIRAFLGRCLLGEKTEVLEGSVAIQ